MSVLSDPIFHDEQAAIAYVESILWPHGPVCPKCGVIDNAYQLKGKRARPGLRRCKDCKKDFTVKVGTIFEASHVTMCHWLQALYLLTASKKGFSAHQLHRTLGVTYKTAWFMFHRLREAMRNDGSVDFGAGGGVVEVDETFIGNDRTIKPKHSKKGRGYAHKHKVLSLVDRSTGRAKSMVVNDLRAKTLVPILKENISKEAMVYTDEAGQYFNLGSEFANHDFVRHGQGEYVRGEVHTNTIEPTFPIYHPNSWNSYHFPTAKGTVSPLQPSDGMILVIGPRLEGHSVIFLAIQTHLSCRFLLAVDSLGLRRSGSSSQIINQAQDFPEQVPRHRHLSQLERNVAAMSDNLGPDLHQLVAQRRHRPVLHLLRQSQCPHEVAQIVGQGVKLEPNGIVAELAT